MYCQYCGAFIQDGVKFCPNCGKKQPDAQPESDRCPYCGSMTEKDSVYCENCGEKLSGTPRTDASPARPAVTPRKTAPKANEKKKKSGCSCFLTLILILLAVAGGYYLWQNYGDRLPIPEKAAGYIQKAAGYIQNVTGNIQNPIVYVQYAVGYISDVIGQQLIQLPGIDFAERLFRTPEPAEPSPDGISAQAAATQAPPQPTATQVPAQPTATQVPAQPTPTQAPPQPTATQVQPQRFEPRDFHASDTALLTDFQWVTESFLSGNLPEGRIRLTDPEDTHGGWKVIIVDDRYKQTGYHLLTLCRSEIYPNGDTRTITFFWDSIYDEQAGTLSKDFSSNAEFKVRWENNTMLCTDGPGSAEFAEFYYLDGHEYAFGTYRWPDSTTGTIIMVRP